MPYFLLLMVGKISLFENISTQNKEATNQSLNECPGVFTSGLFIFGNYYKCHLQPY